MQLIEVAYWESLLQKNESQISTVQQIFHGNFLHIPDLLTLVPVPPGTLLCVLSDEPKLFNIDTKCIVLFPCGDISFAEPVNVLEMIMEVILAPGGIIL